MTVRTHRIAQGLAALALAAGAVLALSAPAQADVLACTDHVKANGYPVGPKVQAACEAGVPWDGHERCVGQLLDVKVALHVADQACHQATLN